MCTCRCVGGGDIVYGRWCEGVQVENLTGLFEVRHLFVTAASQIEPKCQTLPDV